MWSALDIEPYCNGEVLVAGGENNTTGYLSSAELYNPSTGKWTLTGSMTAPRYAHNAVLLQNGEVLVAGGYNASTSSCTNLASAELLQSFNWHLDSGRQHDHRPR
jgi:N-acetylneuraminic acid mutarotase